MFAPDTQQRISPFVTTAAREMKEGGFFRAPGDTAVDASEAEKPRTRPERLEQRLGMMSFREDQISGR
jgi:hypothetical protein